MTVANLIRYQDGTVKVEWSFDIMVKDAFIGLIPEEYRSRDKVLERWSIMKEDIPAVVALLKDYGYRITELVESEED